MSYFFEKSWGLRVLPTWPYLLPPVVALLYLLGQKILVCSNSEIPYIFSDSGSKWGP